MNIRELILNLLKTAEASDETIKAILAILDKDVNVANMETIVESNTQVNITPPQLIDGLCVGCKKTADECGCVKKWVQDNQYENIFSPQIEDGKEVVSIPEIPSETTKINLVVEEEKPKGEEFIDKLVEASQIIWENTKHQPDIITIPIPQEILDMMDREPGENPILARKEGTPEAKVEAFLEEKVGFCGCAMPNKAAKFLHCVLLHFKETRENWPEKENKQVQDTWIKDKIKRQDELFCNHEGIQTLVLYWVHYFGLTEHGGGVMASWLSVEGEELLEAFEAIDMKKIYDN